VFYSDEENARSISHSLLDEEVAMVSTLEFLKTILLKLCMIETGESLQYDFDYHVLESTLMLYKKLYLKLFLFFVNTMHK